MSHYFYIMIKVETFTYNAFQENTYVVIDDATDECIIFDPGCSNANENSRFLKAIDALGATPKRLINTHCHIDHILGNHLINEKYQLPLEAHKGEVSVLASGVQVGQMYGIPYTPSPEITLFIEEGDVVTIGESRMEVLFTPGHSPASLCFVDHESRQVIGGDVLFHGSIGRTDLPGGDYKTLINSIQTKLMTLDDDYVVYPGHGPSTTIGFERANNPFLNQ